MQVLVPRAGPDFDQNVSCCFPHVSSKFRSLCEMDRSFVTGELEYRK